MLSTRTWQILMSALNADVAEGLMKLWQSMWRLATGRNRTGMYEVLDYDVRLELLDAKGQRAVLHKRQKVRFLQDNIIAYQDKAWGDGDIFAHYSCSPGIAVDRYQEGHRYRVLISLRETKNRGDIEEFLIERTIRGGFTRPTEDLQIEIDHRTAQLSISVVFPRNHLPKQTMLVEQNTTQAMQLGPTHHLTLPDGRQEVRWQTSKPRLFEAYILRWEW